MKLRELKELIERDSQHEVAGIKIHAEKKPVWRTGQANAAGFLHDGYVIYVDLKPHYHRVGGEKVLERLYTAEEIEEHEL